MKTVLDYLERSADNYPKKMIIKEPHMYMTYEELVDTAKTVGFNISRYLDGRRNLPIGIFIDKGCECLVAMLGILYSGNTYVPLDIKTPHERMSSIVKTMESEYVITSDNTITQWIKLGLDISCMRLSDLSKCSCEREMMEAYLRDIREKTVDTDLMYIMFTSGSTGNPKGVAITHRSVMDYLEEGNSIVGITNDDVIGNQVPFYVDMSLKDIYMTIASGATIVIIPQTYFMTPKKMLSYLDDNSVTMLMWVPTAYGIVSRFDVLSKVKPRKLCRFVFSGESMPITVYRYWSMNYPTATWMQLYGPTEITGACTSFTVEREYKEGETIPIGKSFPNTGVLLLSEDDKEIKDNQPGTIGEICIFGSCLAAGYYNDWKKTEESFVQNPLIKSYPSRIYRTGDLGRWDENGNLVYIARKDYQIKHGGRRIELGEIDVAADSVEGIKSACCVHDERTDTIVLFYVGSISDKDIRDVLKKKLPQYMIPGRYVALEELPQQHNGKVDKMILKKQAMGKMM